MSEAQLSYGEPAASKLEGPSLQFPAYTPKTAALYSDQLLRAPLSLLPEAPNAKWLITAAGNGNVQTVHTLFLHALLGQQKRM